MLIVILPVVGCTSVAIIISSLKIYQQGINDLKEKSTDILGLNINYFEHIHEDGSMIEEDEENNQDKLGTLKKHYQFRISSPNPENPKHKAKVKELPFIKEFENKETDVIVNIDKKTNALWVMRPIYRKYN